MPSRWCWTMVHVGKLGSWALLVVVSFAMVAAWKGSALREATIPAASAEDDAPEVQTQTVREG